MLVTSVNDCPVFTAGDGASDVLPGNMVYIPLGSRQFIGAAGTEDLEFICIVDPAWRTVNETVDQSIHARTTDSLTGKVV